MPFAVQMTAAAVGDLEDLYAYILRHDSPENAAYVLNQLEDAVISLAEMPDRGVVPQELSRLGMQDFREIFFRPYRIIYRVLDATVYVMVIADGRRDMQTLLQRRLLG
jgi:toxin ParE1/3/4